MAEYSELQNKFHLISGTYIAGQILVEYTAFLKDCFNTKVKGETTKLNRLIEAEAKVLKLVNILGNDLKGIGCDLNVTHAEIDNLQKTLYAVLTLEEQDQKRVLGLIEKIKRQKNETNL